MIFDAISGRTPREINVLGVLVDTALPKERAAPLNRKIANNTKDYERMRDPAISPDAQPLVTSPAFLAAMADALRAELGKDGAKGLQHATNPPGIEEGLIFPRVDPSSKSRLISATPTVGQLVRAGGREEIAGWLADAHSKPVAFAWDWLTSINPIGLIQKLLGVVEGASRPLPVATRDALFGYWRYRRIAAHLQRHSGEILCNVVAHQTVEEGVKNRNASRSLASFRLAPPITQNPATMGRRIRDRLANVSKRSPWRK
jgi:hypothetical protein